MKQIAGMIRAFVMAGAASVLLTAVTATGAPQVNWAGLDAKQAVQDEILVKFKPTVKADAIGATHAKIGAKVLRQYRTKGWQRLRVPKGMTIEQAAARYAAEPNVAMVEPNYIVHALATPNDLLFSQLWGMTRINAPQAWDLTTGSASIVVGVIDSGVRYTHQDLAANTWTNPLEIPGNAIDDDGNGYVDDIHGWDFANDDNNPMDDNGHGTHCAGTIGGVGNNTVGVAGVNWTVKIVGLKFLDASGSGSTGDAIDAVEYASNPALGIKLTSNSWGGGGFSQALKDAIDAAGAQGQLFIAAAGNASADNDSVPHYPSSYDSSNIIAVASVDVTGNMSWFSCFGLTSVDIAAPGGDASGGGSGVEILSTWVSSDTAYNSISGTSMATPHVSGAAALLWGMNPNATWQDIRNAILSSARPNPALAGRMVTGGELDLFAALQRMTFVQLDQLAYRSDAPVQVTVFDPIVAPPTNDVPVAWNTTFPSSVVHASGVVTNSRAGASIQFTGTVQLVTGSLATHGDRFTATYLDPYGFPHTATAPIDDVPPVISSVQVGNVQGTTATVTWRTDEPATSQVKVSPAMPLTLTPWQPAVPAGYSTAAVVSGGVTQYLHSVNVTGLTPGSRYYVAVGSMDYAGNMATAPANLGSTAESDYVLIITRFSSVAYANAMDKGADGWTVESVYGNCWQYGIPTYGPSAPHSGTNCWGTVLGNRYPAHENASLITAPIQVYEKAQMTFWTWYDLAYTIVPAMCGQLLVGLDLGFIEVDDGAGWKNVTSSAGVLSIPPHDCPDLPIADDEAFAGSSGGWVPITIDLSAFSNRSIRVRFRMDSDAFFLEDTVERAGWFIDDVTVTHFRPVGPGVVGYTIDDALSLSLANDADGQPEAGETFYLNLQVFNSDNLHTFHNLLATIGSPDAGVTPSQDDVLHLAYGTLAPGSVYQTGTQLVASVGYGLSVATFLHGMTASDGGPWSDTVVIPIERRVSVTGRVTDLFSAAGIAGAVVRGTVAGHPTIQTTADALGYYKLNGFVPGTSYAVVAGVPGSYSFSDPQSVVGPAANVNFALGKAYASPTPAALSLTLNQASMLTTNIQLSNVAGNIPYRFAVSNTYIGASSGWMTVTPAEGTLAAGATGQLTVRIDSGSLFPNNYEAAIRLIGNDVSGATVVIPVDLTVLQSAVLDLRAVDVYGGDGDAYAEPGETVALDLALANTGGGVAWTPTGTLTSLNPAAATVVTGAAAWPTIFWASTASSVADPQIQIGAGVTNGTVLPFQLDVTDAFGQAWTFFFQVEAQANRTIAGTVTACVGGAPVSGATVQFEGPRRLLRVTTDGAGQYTVAGLPPDTYRVSVVPPSPYDSPAAQDVNVVGADALAVDFCVAAWGLSVNPTSISAMVDENRETNRTLRILNSGTTDGHVTLSVDLVDGVSTGGIGQLAFPPIDWDKLTDKDCAPGQIIVRFKDGAQAQGRAAALDAAGVESIHAFRIIPAVVAKLRAGASMRATAEALERDPNVLYVQPDYRLQWYRVPNDPLYPYLWGMNNDRQMGGTLGADIGAEEGWDTLIGTQDVVVAVVDSGIAVDRYVTVVTNDTGFAVTNWYTNTVFVLGHPDLRDNLWRNPGEDWLGLIPGTNGVDDDGNGYIDDYYGWDAGDMFGRSDDGIWGDNDPYPDTETHGTHVAGTIGAVGDNGIGVAGVNWRVSLMAVKVSDRFGRLLTSYAVEGMEYCIANNVRVSNHSYGWTDFSPLQYEVMQRASLNGQIMVCAAGNDGQNNDVFMHYPCNYDITNLLAVAATDEDDVLAFFSDWGPTKVDIAAPGVDIASTVVDPVPSPTNPRDPNRLNPGYSYNWSSGTSMAAPHVAGVIGMLMARSPWAPPAAIRQALLDGARRNPILDGRVAGSRQLDLPGALEKLDAFWIRLEPADINVPAGGQALVNVVLNAGGLLPAGPYRATIGVHQGLNSLDVPVTLQVNPAPVPVVAALVVEDALMGDGDGRAEPGETVDLRITLLNDGAASLYNPSGVLACAVPGVTVAGGAVTWPSLASDERGAANNSVRVTFGPAVSGPVAFTLTVQDGTHPAWVRTLEVDVAKAYSIRGTVRNSAGGGVSGARVECWGTLAGEVVTGAGGVYAIHGLVPGPYKVRAIPLDHEKKAPTSLTIVAADTTVNFTVLRPVVSLSMNALTAGVQQGLAANAQFQIANSAADVFTYQITKLPRRRIALISDGMQLHGMKPMLEQMGFEVASYTNNFDYVNNYFSVDATTRFSHNDVIVFANDLVIVDSSGRNGEGRLLLPQESDVYNRYLQRGGKLVMTGANPLSIPDDYDLADLCGVLTMDRATETATVAELLREMPSSIFVPVGVRENVGVSPQVYDLATPDIAASAVAYASAGGGAKVVRRTVPQGGVCYLWTGNDSASDWTARGVKQDMFRNLLVAELAGDVPWLTITSPVGDSFASASRTIGMRLDSSAMDIGLHQATLMVRGNYPGAEVRPVQVDFTVGLPSITAASAAGVTDWLGRALEGDGGPDSALFQVVWAGANGVIDPPAATGAATGDDVVLRTYPADMAFGRFGKGFEGTPDYGRFQDLFRLDLQMVQNATATQKTYVRAWDAPTFAGSVAYGDSGLYTLKHALDEAHDFGTWVVNKTLGYPNPTGTPSDANRDSIPDGWEVRTGGDPRLPIGPLAGKATSVAQFGALGTGGQGFYWPSQLFVAGDLVFVLDSRNNAIKVWKRTDHTFMHVYGSVGTGNGQFSQPYGLGKDPNANRFAVADTGNNRIQVFTFNPTTGAITFERKFGTVGNGNGQMRGPEDVAISTLGRFHVADSDNHRIQVFSPTGVYVLQFGAYGTDNGRFNRPLGVAVDAAGLIYVGDTDNHRVQVFSGAGGFIAKFGGVGSALGQLNRPVDIELGVGGRIFVADSSNHRVQIFSASYAPILAVGEPGSTPGQLLFPRGVWPMPNSADVYVADTQNSRVQFFKTITDRDADGMEDVWEMLNGLNPAVNDALIDSDGDGLLNIGEYRIQTDPTGVDSDGDGLNDRLEVVAYATRPDNVDSDGDELTDDQEVLVKGTDPLAWDTDKDRYNDWVEAMRNTDALNPLSFPPYQPNDYDGEGKADIGVFFPPLGTWYVVNSKDWSVRAPINWGWNETVPVPGDYDGDRISDLAVYFPAAGQWFIKRGSNGAMFGGGPLGWGWNQTVPVAADYDGDKKTDLAVFFPGAGQWFVRKSSDGNMLGGGPQAWGWNGTTPVPGDYDGDGKADLAVFFPPAGQWFVRRSTNGAMLGGGPQAWGWVDTVPVPGDYDGDGKTDLAVYYPTAAQWFVKQSSNGATLGGAPQTLGYAGSVPVPADYDGDGKTDLAVFVPTTGDWIVRRSYNGATLRGGPIRWGWSATEPLQQPLWW